MKHVSRRIIALCILLAMALLMMPGTAQHDVTASGSANDQYVKSVLNMKHTLRFGSDGKFKILIFSDIQDKYPLAADTLKYMNNMLDREKPDLVLLGGDNHTGDRAYLGTEAKMRQYLAAMAEPMESRKIPWAQVYGNHHNGGYKIDMGFSKVKQQPIFESFAYNVSKAGTVTGVGNYCIPILRSDSNKIAFNVFMLDSHNYLYQYQSDLEEKVLLQKLDANGKPVLVNGQRVNGGTIYSGKTYDVVHFDQIKWYWDTSVALEQYNGSPIAAMMLFHIPLYEWNYIIKNSAKTGMTGVQKEPISAPEANSGLFQACFERGDVKAMFCGHDHINDFAGKYMGITMGYVPTIGSYNYFHTDNRGARLVEVDQNNAFAFTTRMIYAKNYN